MNDIFVLDTAPLGLVTNPKQSGENLDCYRWLEKRIDGGSRVIVPEIADYEVRRELLRADKVQGLRRLDLIISALEYLPITTEAMKQAALFWAEARKSGRPTAKNEALDGDVILAAQAMTFSDQEVIVVTTNVEHLARFVTAKRWQEL